MFSIYRNKRKEEDLQKEKAKVDSKVEETARAISEQGETKEELVNEELRLKEVILEKGKELKEKQENLKALKKKVSTLKERLNILNVEKLGMEKTLKVTQGELDKYLISSDSYNLKVTEVREKVEDTEKKITENRKKINNLTKEKLQLEWDLKERGNALELNTLKQNNQELLLSKATKENKSLNIELGKIVANIEKAKTKTKELEDEIVFLQKRKANLEESYQKRKTVYEAKDKRNQKLGHLKEDLEREIHEINLKLDSYDSDIKSLQDKLNTVEEVVEVQKNELGILSEKLENRKDTKRSKSSFLERQEQAKELQGKKLKEALKELGITEESITKLEKRLLNIEREINLQKKLYTSRKAKIEKQNKIFDEMTATVADSEARRDEINRQLSNLQATIKENDVHIDNKKELLSKLNSEKDKLEEKIFDLKLRSKEKLKLIEDLENKITGVKKKIEHKKEVYSSNEKERARQNGRIDSLELEKQRTFKEIDHVESKIREIEDENRLLSEKIATLLTEKNNLENLLKDNNEKSYGLERTKVQKVEEKLFLEGQIKEKEFLLKNQKDFITNLELEISSLENSYSKGQEEGLLLTENIEKNKEKCSELDGFLAEMNEKMSGLQKELKVIIADNLQSEQALKDRIFSVFSQGELTQDMKSRVEKAISEIEKKKNEQDLILANQKENIESSIEVLHAKERELSCAIKEQKRLATEIDKAKREIVRLHGEIKETQKRIMDKSPIYEENSLALENILVEAATLKDKLRDYSMEERELDHTIKEKSKKLDSLSQDHRDKEEIIKELHTRIIELRAEREHLEIKETNNKKQLKGQTGQVRDLAEDLESLEEAVGQMRERVSVQDSAISKNVSQINHLVSRNQELSNQIKELELIKDKNKDLILKDQSHIMALESNLKKLEVELADFPEDLLVGNKVFEKTNNKLNFFENTDLTQSISGLVTRLEIKHFNLSFDLKQNEFDKNVTSLEKDKVKSFENIISRFVETIESQIDVQAESLCKLSIKNGLFKAFCSFSISETKVTNEEAKKVMLPYTKKILTEFGSIGLGVKFRVKMDSAENIEKIGIHLHLPIKPKESHATEEDNRPKEI